LEEDEMIEERTAQREPDVLDDVDDAAT